MRIVANGVLLRSIVGRFAVNGCLPRRASERQSVRASERASEVWSRSVTFGQLIACPAVAIDVQMLLQTHCAATFSDLCVRLTRRIACGACPYALINACRICSAS